jgi:REP element-mobilizing transposase RayT
MLKLKRMLYFSRSRRRDYQLLESEDMKQKTLFKVSDYNSEFGGTLLAGKRKSRRPFSSRNAMKLVLRADIKESGSLLKHRLKIESELNKLAEKFGIKIYEKALVSNHIHMTAHFFSRGSYNKFIRAFTGTASKSLRIKWPLRPWTRILSWGRALKTAIQYTKQNHLEAIQAIPYQPRKKDLQLSRSLVRELELMRIKKYSEL